MSDIFGPLDTIESAFISDAGLTGPFSQQVALMTTARYGHSVVVLGNYVYVIGGAGGLKSVERGTINADGTLSGFTTSGIPALLADREAFSTVVLHDKLFVVGGRSDGGVVGTVERTSIDTSNNLTGGWVDAGVALLAPRYGHASAVVGPNLYVFGGTTIGGAPLATIEVAPIDSAWNLGAFTDAGTTLTAARERPVVVTTDDFLFVIGGRGDGAVLPSIERIGLR